jgi:hypothetical protein
MSKTYSASSFRRFMLEPIPEIFEAAGLLDAAAAAHVSADHDRAARLFAAADKPALPIGLKSYGEKCSRKSK